MPRTKIVCTIGPASKDAATIRKMLRAGMNVARVNFSHGNAASHFETVETLRRVADEENKVLAILGDLQGPKIRLGQFDPYPLSAGDVIKLSSDPNKEDTFHLPHPEIVEALQPGSSLVLGDGELELVVLDKEGDVLNCQAVFDGVLEQRKGINTPGTKIPIDSITAKDRVDLKLICELNLDFVALSFVRSADDLHELRELMEAEGKKIPVIAKIEKFEAIEALEEIARTANGLMVARGDLGLDLPTAQLPMLQKRIIRIGNQLGIPVITATQMLQSMTINPRPTRAEASDVANAILDGTDAVMLSGETASGKYPVESVTTMNQIATFTEQEFPYDSWIDRRKSIDLQNISDAISTASCNIAERVNAKLIVTSTMTGHTARQIARHRPVTPIIAVSPLNKTRRELALVWGVECVRMGQVDSTDEMIDGSLSALKEYSYDLQPKDLIILTGGVPFGRTGQTNLIQVHEV